MQIFRSLNTVPPHFGPSAVTIGKFDGVHAGHRAVIAQLVSVAEKTHDTSTVVTFDRHPLSLLAPEKSPTLLTSVEQKLELLAETGINATLLLPFDRALSQLLPEEFIHTVIVNVLHARTVLVGEDFRFGRNGAGTVKTLQELAKQGGYEVCVIEEIRPMNDERVSSTSIRGIVVPGARRGRKLGFPTANLSPQLEGFIPADGVYAGWLTDANKRYPAAISVGNNPTFKKDERRVEVYVLDENIDLYQHHVKVTFVQHVRDQIVFTTVESLIEQIRDDVEQVRLILNTMEDTQ
jgi:riboflavin kinase/FMN adenylyltransferase